MQGLALNGCKERPSWREVRLATEGDGRKDPNELRRDGGRTRLLLLDVEGGDLGSSSRVEVVELDPVQATLCVEEGENTTVREEEAG